MSDRDAVVLPAGTHDVECEHGRAFICAPHDVRLGEIAPAIARIFGGRIVDETHGKEAPHPPAKAREAQPYTAA